MDVSMEQYRRGDLVFDVLDAGPADGPVVVLLHGWPQSNIAWEGIIPRLVAQGYRCLAPNTRGYSPGARPPRRRDYQIPELVDDVCALIDASGVQRAHLVGHDWGAAIAWGVAALAPERLITVSPLSVPHTAAFMKALVTSRQGLASWYMYFFQLPILPELVLLGRDGKAARLAQVLRVMTKQAREIAKRDAATMMEPGRLTAALNYYRALPLSDVRLATRKVAVPTMYVWSDDDSALLAKAAHDSARYVTGEYRFETLHGVSHWMLDEQPQAVADLLLEWFASHPE
jgi:pimeloyl-ACP methyl ester carboxylesterase